MDIKLTNVGKRFNTEWIFRGFHFEFASGHTYAITGPNGSGKSTLLQVIGNFLQHNAGSISYFQDGVEVQAEKVYRHTSLAAPYLEVIEEMTLAEFLSFHQKMKGLMADVSIETIAASVSLEKALHKQIRYYSSGMKQRVKLAQAFYSNTSLLLLDEPLTNLDAEGHRTYENLLAGFAGGRTIIVSSNDEKEYHFCKEIIDIAEYK